MTINTELLIKVREKIREHPDQHEQGHWARRAPCGTTYCIAGWAAVLSGATLDWETGYWGIAYADTVNDGACAVSTYAADKLGLKDGGDLFCVGNDDALRRLDQLIEKGKNAA